MVTSVTSRYLVLLREGFDAYVSKPVDRQFLLKTVHQYLAGRPIFLHIFCIFIV